jgi:Rrf2 family protein
MELRNQVEWALHCCGMLAGLSDGDYLATKDLAEFHGIPKEYLSKALQSLSQAGLVESTLGPRGGYRLAKRTDQITFLEIVEAVEGRKSTFKCTEIRKNNPCLAARQRGSGTCAIARVMYGADEAWRNHLRTVRLSDLLTTLNRELSQDLRERIGDWVASRGINR